MTTSVVAISDTWQHLQNTVFNAEVVRALVVASILAGAAALRRLLKERKTQSHYRDEMRAQFEQVQAKLDNVDSQLQTNSGSSLRDAVNRIELTAKHTSERLDEHIDWSNYQVQRVDKLSDRDAERRSGGRGHREA